MKNRHLKQIFLGVVFLSAIPAVNLLCLLLLPDVRALFFLLSGLSVLTVLGMRERAELKSSYIALCVIFPVTAPLLVVSAAYLAYISRIEMPQGRCDVRPDLSDTPELIRGAVAAAISLDPTAEITCDFSAEYFSSGEAMAEDILREISLAEEFIYLEYYIVSEGEFLGRLTDALARAASRGVKVSLLYDDLGSITGVAGDFSLRLARLGILAVPFSPISASAWKTNPRDHRKLIVIDGRTVYTGGINISDEYLYGQTSCGRWKDSGLKIKSPSPLSVGESFEFMLAIACRENFEDGRSSRLPYKRGEGGNGPTCLFFSSYPQRMYGASVAREVIISLLYAVKESLVIASPYFIPDAELFEAILRAARRGVEITVILPGVPDKRFVKAVAESFYCEMLLAGVKIYEYTPGFLHSKILLADGEAALVGSINFDQRSLYQNFECAALIYAKGAVSDIRDDLDRIISESALVGEPLKYRSLKKKAARLFFEAALPIL